MKYTSMTLLLAASVFCQGPISMLSDAEKSLVRDSILMMEDLFSDCPHPTNPALTMLDADVSTLLQGAGVGQECYEEFESNPATIRDLLTHARWMITHDRIRKHAHMGGGASTHGVSSLQAPPNTGLEHDVVLLGQGLLLFDDNAAAPPAQRVWAVLEAGWILINEMAHVFQKNTATNFFFFGCDAERDSDVMSVTYMDCILAALSQASGASHATVAAVESMRLRNFMTAQGLPDARVAHVHGNLQNMRGAVDNRAMEFENAPQGWIGYYRTAAHRFVPISVDPAAPNRLLYAPPTIFWVGTSPVPVGVIYSITFPAGFQVVNAAFFLRNGKLCAYLAARSAAGILFMTYLCDLDGDGSLETQLAPLTQANFSPLPSGPHSLHTEGVHVALDAFPNFAGGPDLPIVIMHDPDTGSLHGSVPEDPFLSQPTLITQDPALQTGDFEYLYDIESDGFSARIIFSESPPSVSDGATLTIAFDVDLFGFSIFNTTVGPLAAARASNILTYAGVEPGSTGPITCQGTPGDTVQLTQLDAANQPVVTTLTIGSDGWSASATVTAPLPGVGLYEITSTMDPTQNQIFLTLSSGFNLDFLHEDLDGDGDDDIVGLFDRSWDDSLAGFQFSIDELKEYPKPDQTIITWAFDPSQNPAYVYTIINDGERETYNPYPNSGSPTITPGSFEGRGVVLTYPATPTEPHLGIQGIHSLRELAPFEPIPEQKQWHLDYQDLDGDGIASEFVNARYVQPGGQWVLEIYDDTGGSLPVLIDSEILDLGPFPLGAHGVGDRDGDGDPDIWIRDAVPGHPVLELVNDGTGDFTPVPRPDVYMYTEVTPGSTPPTADAKALSDGVTLTFGWDPATAPGVAGMPVLVLANLDVNQTGITDASSEYTTQGLPGLRMGSFISSTPAALPIVLEDGFGTGNLIGLPVILGPGTVTEPPTVWGGITFSPGSVFTPGDRIQLQGVHLDATVIPPVLRVTNVTELIYQ